MNLHIKDMAARLSSAFDLDDADVYALLTGANIAPAYDDWD